MSTTANSPVSAEQAAPAPTLPVSTWERFSFSVLRTVVYGLARVLTLPGLYRFGRLFGLLEWAVNYKRRRRFASRVRQLFGDEQPRTPVWKAALRHSMRDRCDKLIYLITDMLPRETVLSRFSIVNQHLLDEALARGNGVYIALCHMGVPHVAGLMLSLMGYRAAGVRAPREGALRRYIQMMYEHRYDEIRAARRLYSDSFPREIFRCFQENYIVGGSLDVLRERDPHLKTVDVTFFGQRRRFLTGTVQIALRCGAPMIQAFVLSDRDFRYRMELVGPLLDDPGAKETPELLQQVVQQYADNVERYIRKYPDHISRV